MVPHPCNSGLFISSVLPYTNFPRQSKQNTKGLKIFLLLNEYPSFLSRAFLFNREEDVKKVFCSFSLHPVSCCFTKCYKTCFGTKNFIT